MFCSSSVTTSNLFQVLGLCQVVLSCGLAKRTNHRTHWATEPGVRVAAPSCTPVRALGAKLSRAARMARRRRSCPTRQARRKLRVPVPNQARKNGKARPRPVTTTHARCSSTAIKGPRQRENGGVAAAVEAASKEPRWPVGSSRFIFPCPQLP